MIKYKLNEPFYKLHFSELPEDAVQVYAFSGEEGLSQLFEYRLTLLSDDPELNAADILNKKATFTLARGDEEPVHIHGLISHFEQRGRDANHVFYEAVLVPKMWRLHLTYQSEVYQDLDMEKLIAKVLETAGFASDDFEINLAQSYPPQEYTVQYRETNFNFLNRRLEHFGIYYYFDHRDGNDVMVFTDANNNLPEIAQTAALSYNPKRDILGETETIGTLACREKVVTGLVKLKDYNYLDPNTDLTAESQIDAEAPGMYYEFGDHFADKSQAAFLAKVRNEEIIAGSKIFQGVSDCRLFRAGFKFAIDKHYREAWNTEYLLTRVTARGAQKSLFGSLSPSAPDEMPTYENKFEALPVDIPYRPPRRTPVPRVAGIMSAKIETASGDEYAYIDDHGRYRAKMLFDLTDRRNGEATLAVRQVQAYSGSSYGIHFPNHAGTELVWACVDGNADRPISLGTVPNPSQASPVTGNNHTINMIKTASNNFISMDDTRGVEKLDISTPYDNSISAGNDQKISVGKNRAVSISQDDSQSVGGNRDIKVSGNKTEKIDGKNDLTVTGDDTEKFEATRSITVKNDDTEKYKAKRAITVTSDDTETYQAKRTVSVTADDAETYKAKRTISVTGNDQENYGANRKVGIVGNDELTVGGTLQMTSTGKLSATGNGNVEIKGPQIKITGDTEVTITVGGSSIKITPEGIEISSPKITSAATGPHEISGAMIKLN